jgi:hypothetical protein
MLTTIPPKPLVVVVPVAAVLEVVAVVTVVVIDKYHKQDIGLFQTSAK